MWAWLLLAYLAQAQNINKKLSAALAWGGSISFSIYVMHNLVLATMRKFVPSTLWSSDVIL
jgi:peptidoglycan/LPS O-acetylase OafA/YrhL